MSELIKIESVEELKSVDKSKAKQIKATFDPMVEMLESFESAYNDIILESEEVITDDLMQRAKRLRLDIAKIRIESDKTRKELKEEYLRAGNAVQGTYNIIKWAVQDKENKLKEIEEHFDRLEEERLIKLQSERVVELSKYVDDAEERDLASMDDDVWSAYLGSKKQAHEDRIKAEKKAEEERIAKEKAEAEERERIRLENERLKKEAEERERLAKIEAEKRAKEEAKIKAQQEAERKEHEEALRKEREERERIEAEARAKQEKIEAELKAKKEAELKAQQEEENRKREEEKLAKKKALAPEVERLNEWVDAFEVPVLLGEETKKSKEIESKFKAFKVWAKKEVDKMLEEVMA